MTIICAKHEQGVGTWIASDSLVCGGTSTMGEVDKWVIKNKCAVGISGAMSILSIVNEQIDFDAKIKPTDLYKKICDELVNRNFKPKTTDGESPWFDFSMIFATPNRAYVIDATGGVIPDGINGYCMRGSGAEYAEGAAYILAKTNESIQNIVKESLEAAVAHCRGCGGKIKIQCLDGK